jgi:hypothetical protein
MPPRSTVSGVRSSWAASAANRRVCPNASSSRASIPFRVSASRSSSSAQVLGGDAAGGARHLVHRAQGDARDDRAAERGEPHPERDQHDQGVEVAIADRLGPPERHADLDDLGHAAVLHHRQGEEPDRLRAAHRHRLDRALAAGGPNAGRGRERQQIGPPSLAEAVRPSLGIEQLDELVVELGAQQLAQERLGVAGRPLGGSGVLDDLGDGEQGGVEVLLQAEAEPGVGQRADRHQDGEEHAAVPEGELGVDRERQAEAPHGSALSM